MPDLDERFRSLSRTSAPDLWEDIGARPPGPLPRPAPGRRILAGVTALAVAVAGFVVVIAAFRDTRPARDAAVESPTSVPVENGQIAVSVGPDQDIVLLDPGTGAATSLVERRNRGQEGSLAMAWSPDGTKLAFTDLREDDSVGLFVLDVVSGDVIDVSMGLAHADDPAWSPDGTRVAFTGFDGAGGYEIHVVGVHGAGSRPVTDEPDDGVSGAFMPTWSPDGTRIAFAVARYDAATETEFSGIAVLDLGTGHRTLVAESQGVDESPSWSPDGTSIAFLRKAIDAAQVVVASADGSGERRIEMGLGVSATSPPRWSPDGRHLLFGSFDQGTSNQGVAIANTDGTDARTILEDAYAGAPIWSPDGSLIAFVGDDAGRPLPAAAIRVVRLDGSRDRTVAALEDVSGVAWQPLAAPSSTVEPSPALAEPVAVEIRVTTTTGVAEFPSAVAVGEGAVWVTSCCTDGSGSGEVVRLDPETGDVVARIPVRAVPGWDFGGAGLAVGSGSVWTLGSARADGGCCEGVVTRIDPATSSIVDELTVPGITDGDVWVDGSAVYVLGFAAEGWGLELAKLAATDDMLEWRVSVPGQWSQTVFVAGGSVWVLGTAPDAHGPVEVTMLYRFDPTTGVLLDQVSLQQSMYIPAIQADTMWFRTQDGAQRFDAASGELVGETVHPAPGCCIGPFVSDGAGGVWIVSSPGSGLERSIWHIDASGVTVGRGAIEDKGTFEQMLGQSYAFDPATQTIWVQNYQDSITRVEITPATSGP